MTTGVINNWVNLNVTGRISPESIDTGAITATSVTAPVIATTLLLSSTPPATATSTGVKGTITYDADYIYVCVATNTWVRAAIATWV